MASAVRGERVVLSYDDLDFIPKEREGDRHELFDGALVVTPSPVPDHQRLTVRAVFRFAPVVEAGVGEIFTAPVDVRFTPGNVVVPDLVFVRRDRLGIVGAKVIAGPPDLILEILSPSTRRRDQRQKMALYARFAVPEYWMVDPGFRTVIAFQLRDGRYERLPEDGGLVRSAVATGFALDVGALFAGL